MHGFNQSPKVSCVYFTCHAWKEDQFWYKYAIDKGNILLRLKAWYVLSLSKWVTNSGLLLLQNGIYMKTLLYKFIAICFWDVTKQGVLLFQLFLQIQNRYDKLVEHNDMIWKPSILDIGVFRGWGRGQKFVKFGNG